QMGGGAGFSDVSANNPFRQSMYPAQPDLVLQQAMMANQMSQLSLQPQPQQSQQSAYNPFAQRQTMYMGSFQQQQPQQQPFAMTAATSFGGGGGGGGQAPSDQFASFSAFGNNGGSGQQQQQFHQQQPVAAATANNNNNNNNSANFADFGVFGQ
ncbi:hypothetical protein GGF42_009499, partial [Coemansia sp. RSA 2424]